MKLKTHLIWETGYHYNEQGNFVDEPHFSLYPFKVNDNPGRVYIKELEFDVDVPADFDPVPKVIEGLKAEKKRIQAETNVKINNLEDQIQRLLSIEHNPEVEL